MALSNYSHAKACFPPDLIEKLAQGCRFELFQLPSPEQTNLAKKNMTN